MKIDVSIIIVNYKTPVLLKNCITSIFDKTEGVNFEIIVVDNNSNDGSETLINDNFPSVTYLQSGSNLGFGKANNRGISIAKGRNIFFLNSDTILLNNAIKILSDYLDENSNVGVCGGNLFDERLKHIHSFSPRFPGIYTELDAILNGKLSKLKQNNTLQYNTENYPMQVAYICGADMMVKASVLEQVGVFDPDFFLYFEETELSFRIKKQGYVLFNVPQAKIIHLEGASQTSSKPKLTFYNTSRKKYYKKRYNLFKFFIVSWLFRLKCFIGLLKNILVFEMTKTKMWYYNLLTFK